MFQVRFHYFYFDIISVLFPFVFTTIFTTTTTIQGRRDIFQRIVNIRHTQKEKKMSVTNFDCIIPIRTENIHILFEYFSPKIDVFRSVTTVESNLIYIYVWQTETLTQRIG